MIKMLKLIGYDENLHFKNKIVYPINAISLCLGLFFSFFYVFVIKYYPAMPGILVYSVSCIIVFILLKYRKFRLAKAFVILGILLQNSSVVFLWFPRDTGFNFYYFLIAPITFFIYDYQKKDERFLIVFFNVLASLLLFLSESTLESANLISVEKNVLLLFRGISVVSASFSIVVVFFFYAYNLNKVDKELHELASIDSLTNIFNRRILFEEGEKLVLSSRKHNHHFTLILFDIDHFKDVNDEYGHPVGDQVLIQLAEVVSSHIRTKDIFSRYGGEEFALIIRDTYDEDGLLLADKIRKTVENHPFEVSDSKTIQLTISLGVISYTNNFDHFDLMVKSVDKALYKAKENGRNQSVEGTIESESRSH